MKKKTLNKKEKKELNVLLAKYNFEFSKNDFVEIIDDKYVRMENQNIFFYLDGNIFPTMKLVLSKELGLKKAVLDMGAIKFIANGADLMRPGIVSVDDGINAGDVVMMADVTHKKPFALGIALYSSLEIMKMSSGKVIKNLHYVGDEVWNS